MLPGAEQKCDPSLLLHLLYRGDLRRPVGEFQYGSDLEVLGKIPRCPTRVLPLQMQIDCQRLGLQCIDDTRRLSRGRPFCNCLNLGFVRHGVSSLVTGVKGRGAITGESQLQGGATRNSRLRQTSRE